MTTASPQIGELPTPILQPSRRDYIAISSEATRKLLKEVQEHGVISALSLPSSQPDDETVLQNSWGRGAAFDGYSYLASKLVAALDRNSPDSTCERDEITKMKIRGFYGQLGASILLRCLQKGVDAYEAAVETTSVQECGQVMTDSYDSAVKPLAAQSNAVGTRLEILYGLTARGLDRYSDYAITVPTRYGFSYSTEPYPHIVLDDWSHALYSAGLYTELEPTIPRKLNLKQRCPLEIPTAEIPQATSLRILWGIAITACKESQWLWPQLLQPHVANNDESQ